MPTTKYKKEEPPTTRFSEVINEAMETHGVSIRDIAETIDITYEHARRIVKGEAIPSRFIIRLLAPLIQLDSEELERVANADKIRKTYGTLPLELSGKIPGMEPLERVWHNLTEGQKGDLIAQAQAWAKRNKASARAAS